MEFEFVYKAGDKVKVREDLVLGQICCMKNDNSSTARVNQQIYDRRGQIVTIARTNDYGKFNRGYTIKEDTSWFWVDSMFEEKVEE